MMKIIALIGIFIMMGIGAAATIDYTFSLGDFGNYFTSDGVGFGGLCYADSTSYFYVIDEDDNFVESYDTGLSLQAELPLSDSSSSIACNDSIFFVYDYDNAEIDAYLLNGSYSFSCNLPLGSSNITDMGVPSKLDWGGAAWSYETVNDELWVWTESDNTLYQGYLNGTDGCPTWTGKSIDTSAVVDEDAQFGIANIDGDEYVAVFEGLYVTTWNIYEYKNGNYNGILTDNSPITPVDFIYFSIEDDILYSWVVDLNSDPDRVYLFLASEETEVCEYGCTAYEDCQPDSYQACLAVNESIECGYDGNYSEFNQSCSYIIPLAGSPAADYGIQSTLSEAGEGIGEMLTAIRIPTGKFILFFAVIGAVVALIIGIIFAVRGMLSRQL